MYLHHKKDEPGVQLQPIFFKLIDFHNEVVGDSDKACYIFETQFNFMKLLTFATGFLTHPMQRVAQSDFLERLDANLELLETS